MSFAGWIANHVDASMARAPENLAALERLLGEPALAVIPHSPGDTGSLVLAGIAEQLARRTISF